MTIKALIVRQPYAGQIAAGTKPIEFRSQRTHFRGWLAIQASKRIDSGPDSGRIVCFVQLVDCVENGYKDFHWVVRNPVPCDQRIELPGRLGIFDCSDKIPQEIKDQLTRIPLTSATANAPAYVAPQAPGPAPKRKQRIPAGAMEVETDEYDTDWKHGD